MYLHVLISYDYHSIGQIQSRSSSNLMYVDNNSISNSNNNPLNDINAIEIQQNHQISSSLVEQIEKLKTIEELKLLWKTLKENFQNKYIKTNNNDDSNDNTQQVTSTTTTTLTTFIANKLMSTSLSLEAPDVAIDIFESLFGFQYNDKNPISSINKLFNKNSEEILENFTWADVQNTPPTAITTSSATTDNNGM